MPTTIVSAAQFHQDAQVKSKAGAYAEILQGFAGRIRHLAELAMGKSIKDGEDAAIERNPQGLLGVDFSGPPFGSAWRHACGGSGGLKPDIAGAGQWSGHRTLGEVEAGQKFSFPFRLWVRPHTMSGAGFVAPYSRMYPILRLYQSSAVAAFDVTVRCLSAHSEAGALEEVVSVSSTSEAVFEITDAWFDVVPGGPMAGVSPFRNRCLLELETSSTTAAVLASLSFNQISKRGH